MDYALPVRPALVLCDLCWIVHFAALRICAPDSHIAVSMAASTFIIAVTALLFCALTTSPPTSPPAAAAAAFALAGALSALVAPGLAESVVIAPVCMWVVGATRADLAIARLCRMTK